MKWPTHGSNPQFLYDAVKLPMPETVLDFSANINPLGPPQRLKEGWDELFSLITDYPDPTASRLTSMLAAKEGITEREILVGNGGAELISLVGRLLAGKRVLILQPTFSEYEEACRVNGCQIQYHLLDLENWDLNIDKLIAKLPEVDAVFLCNPNNPTGMFFGKNIVEFLASECKKKHSLFIVDEAFYDFVRDYESTVPCIHTYDNMLIIRSMTKMFSIPGLRLGYIMGSELLLSQLRRLKPHWSVNALAMKAGEWCLNDHTYIERTITLIENEREKLRSFYQKNDFSVSPSKVNFYLLKDLKSDDQLPFFMYLLENGIIPRHTMNFPGLEGDWLRLAIKGPNDHERLMEVTFKWRRAGK